MTWGEFKAAVEAAGVLDDTKIVDVEWDTFYPYVKVEFGANGSVVIVGSFDE